MAIQAAKLLALNMPEKTARYGEREAMLYAVGIGLGADPLDRRTLPFVYEKNLKAFPTLATVIAWDESWVPQSGLDFVKVLHGEQRIVWHRPLPPAAALKYRVRITDIFDKGAGKGALLVVETHIRLADSGADLVTLTSVVFARGDGGFGGENGGPPPLPGAPAGAPDWVVDLPTRPEAALVYRLSGDVNPLHCDPDVAQAAGFPQPILHGLNFYGVAAHAVVKAACDYDPARLKAIAARFSAPVYPGETIRTEIWRTPEGAQFRARVVERDVVCLNNGVARIG